MVYISQGNSIHCIRYLLYTSPYTLQEYASIIGYLQQAMHVDYKVELQLVNDAVISGYSQQFHDVFAPTNILSFEAGENDGSAMLILSLQTARRESILYGQEYSKYLLYLITHGFVHSCGFEHGVAMDSHCERCYNELIRLL